MPESQMVSLPIDQYLSKIIDAFKKTNQVILTAPPGTGKTIRVPAALARDLIKNNSEKKIVVLVPKRIAALSAAYRIAEENNWQIGEQVGYQVRFEQKYSNQTKLLFMTEGVFVKRMNSPEFIKNIDTVIFDEFHERSSLNDIAFGFCYEQQVLSDEKFNFLIMSATLDTKKLKKFLDQSIHIDIELKPYPLQIIRGKKSQRIQFDFSLIDLIIETLKDALKMQQKDILIFLPGLSEIRQVQNKMRQVLPLLQCEILHGSIHIEEQKRILATSEKRRVILSTNIAESSLTLPSVDCVIDTGLEKKSIVENKIGFRGLELKRISLFSARQRAGRAARTGPGSCFQLWHESDERSMSEQIEPEIIKSLLIEETLILVSAGFDPKSFSWLDQPQKTFESVLMKFKKWNLINEKNQITELGKLVQKCPLDIERGLLFISLAKAGFQNKAAKLTALLETTDFSKINYWIELDEFSLTDMGRRIEKQLSQFLIKTEPATQSFEKIIIKTFLKYFPEKMAQLKNDNTALSSLGRGLQLPNHLILKDCDYYVLLAGKEISDSMTQIQFAIGFNQKLFEELSQTEIYTETVFEIDFEKRILYKQEKKMSGYFLISISSKQPVNDVTSFKNIFAENINDFIEKHPDSKTFYKKINFLKKMGYQIGYNEKDFFFLEDLSKKIYESLSEVTRSINEFFNFDLLSLLIYLTPEEIQLDLNKLSSSFNLPNGKTVPIDYECELAPQISIRVQDALGLFKTPTLLDQRLKISIELLAPNYRPAQITSDLENFWKTSYLDIRKDFRARYPKHDWPENPLDWRPEMSKRLKK